jgi:hypothetical protein
MNASAHGSRVHSVSARSGVSSGGPWYPAASGTAMAATLPAAVPGYDNSTGVGSPRKYIRYFLQS